jgi:integrase/recombinase XerD
MKKTKSNPATVYLNSLSPSGRRSMQCLLKTALTLLNKRQAIDRFRWQTLTYGDLITIKMKLQEQGRAVNTINLTLAAVRGVMQSAFHLGLLKADQLLHIQAVKRQPYRPSSRGRSLTQRECKKMMKQCVRDKSVKGIRDAALLSIMLTTGLRRNEVKYIDVTDYDSKKHELNCVM